MLNVTGYYPPIYHLTTLPFLAIFGYSLSSACLVNLLYLLILVWATYGIGKRLYNKLTGLLAAFLVSVYPYIAFMTNSFVIDLALASMVTLGMYLYLRSDEFTKRWPSILFGLVCGVGVLVKWTYGFFLIGPLLYSLWQAIRQRREQPGMLKNTGMSLLIGFVVAWPWYSYNLIKFVRYSIRFSSIGANEGDPMILSLSSWLYYGKNLLLQVQPVLLVLFVLGLLVYLITWKRQNKLLFWWLVLPYIILTMIRNKDERYTLPFLAAVSIISCFWLVNIKKNVIKYVLISLVVVFGITQYFITSFGRVGNYYCQPPHPENWQQKAVCELILKTIPAGKTYTSVSVVANHSFWHSETLQFYAGAHQLPILFKGYSRDLGQFADYIITKSGDIGPAFTLGQMPEARELILSKAKNDATSGFCLLGSFALPDDSWLFVFRREVNSQTFFPRKFNANELESKLVAGMKKYFKEAEGLAVKISSKTMEEAQRGRFEQVNITARKIKINEIWLSDVAIGLKGLQINLPLLWDEGKLIVYAMDEVHPAFSIKAQDLYELLLKKAKGLQNPLVSIQHNVLNVEGDWRDIHLRVKAGIVQEQDKIYAQCFKLKIGWLRIPRWLYQGIIEKPFMLSPVPEWPVSTKIGKISLQDDVIRVQ